MLVKVTKYNPATAEYEVLQSTDDVQLNKLEALASVKTPSVGTAGNMSVVGDIITLQAATSISANSKKITSLAAPIDGTDAVNKNYVDSNLSGLTWRDPVNELAADHTDSGVIGLAVDDRVINTTDDKIYTVTSTAGGTTGDLVTWDAGTAPVANWAVFEHVNDSGWNYNGTDWVQFTGAGAINAAAGLGKTGNSLYVSAGNGIKIAEDAVAVSAGDGLSVSAAGLSVNPSDLAGAGIIVSGGDFALSAGNGLALSGKELAVSLGVGLSFGTTGQINAASVSAEDFDGEGLRVNTAGELAINAGNGVIVSVDAVTLSAGNGLTLTTAGLSVNIGNGLAFGTDGQINAQLGASDFDGDGLRAQTSGELAINAGNGIEITGDAVAVKLGSGLTFDTGALKVDQTAISTDLITGTAKEPMSAGHVCVAKVGGMWKALATSLVSGGNGILYVAGAAIASGGEGLFHSPGANVPNSGVLAALTSGAKYYLSSNTAGLINTVPPTSSGLHVVEVGISGDSASDGLEFQPRKVIAL